MLVPGIARLQCRNNTARGCLWQNYVGYTDTREGSGGSQACGHVCQMADLLEGKRGTATTIREYSTLGDMDSIAIHWVCTAYHSVCRGD